VKTIKLLLAASAATMLMSVSGPAAAQDKAGYWTNPASGNTVWKNSTGLCWRAGYWTPAMAIAECDPDLVPKAPAPTPAAPAPAPAPKPAPAPAPKPAAAAAAKTLVITSTALFDFDKTTLTPAAKESIDKQVVDRLKEFSAIKFINVNGHTDRLGSAQYNQKLSERRAETIKAYLISKGADAAKIETYGFGKTLQIKSCPDQKDRKALIACLEPNRRVVVEINGLPK
jgi:OOP family OmpA-OmpF porin